MEVFSLHGFCLIVCRKVSQCIWTCYTVCVYLVLLIHTELILAHTIYREAHWFWALKQNQVLHFQQQHPLAWSHWGLCSCTVKWILCPSAKDLSCQEKQVSSWFGQTSQLSSLPEGSQKLLLLISPLYSRERWQYQKLLISFPGHPKG